jgi:hypothetical protein
VEEVKKEMEKEMKTKEKFNLDRHIQFQDIKIHSAKSSYMGCVIREVIEIGVHSSMNREVGLILSRLWRALMCSLSIDSPHTHVGDRLTVSFMTKIVFSVISPCSVATLT